MDRSKLNKKFHGLLNELGAADNKEDLLSAYGVTSSRDLSDEQLASLCDSLSNEKQQRLATQLKSLRSIVLRLLTDMGVYYVAPNEGKYDCWSRVNAFLASPKISGAELYKLSPDELNSLIRKLRSMKDRGYYYCVENNECEPTVPKASSDLEPKVAIIFASSKIDDIPN